jgi:hypothetical protein
MPVDEAGCRIIAPTGAPSLHRACGKKSSGTVELALPPTESYQPQNQEYTQKSVSVATSKKSASSELNRCCPIWSWAAVVFGCVKSAGYLASCLMIGPGQPLIWVVICTAAEQRHNV